MCIIHECVTVCIESTCTWTCTIQIIPFISIAPGRKGKKEELRGLRVSSGGAVTRGRLGMANVAVTGISTCTICVYDQLTLVHVCVLVMYFTLFKMETSGIVCCL